MTFAHVALRIARPTRTGFALVADASGPTPRSWVARPDAHRRASEWLASSRIPFESGLSPEVSPTPNAKDDHRNYHANDSHGDQDDEPHREPPTFRVTRAFRAGALTTD